VGVYVQSCIVHRANVSFLILYTNKKIRLDKYIIFLRVIFSDVTVLWEGSNAVLCLHRKWSKNYLIVTAGHSNAYTKDGVYRARLFIVRNFQSRDLACWTYGTY
jgi:hypothetical protein